MIKKSSRALLHAPRLLVVEVVVVVKVVVAVAVVAAAVEAIEEKMATVKVDVAVAIAVMAVRAVVAVTVTEKVVVAVVIAVAMARVVEEADPELKVAKEEKEVKTALLAEAIDPREVVGPDKTGLEVRPVRMPTRWTDKMALVVGAVVTAKTAIAEADGVKVIRQLHLTTLHWETRMLLKRKKRKKLDQFLSLSRRKKRKSVLPLTSTERNKLLAPRDYSQSQKK